MDPLVIKLNATARMQFAKLTSRYMQAVFGSQFSAKRRLAICYSFVRETTARVVTISRSISTLALKYGHLYYYEGT